MSSRLLFGDLLRRLELERPKVPRVCLSSIWMCCCISCCGPPSLIASNLTLEYPSFSWPTKVIFLFLLALAAGSRSSEILLRESGRFYTFRDAQGKHVMILHTRPGFFVKNQGQTPFLRRFRSLCWIRQWAGGSQNVWCPVRTTELYNG